MKALLIRFSYGIALASVASYGIMAVRGPHGLRALNEKRTEIQAMEKRNAALAQEIERKREHIRRLEENPAEQELEIRERLKLVRPNEKIYIIGEPPKK